MEKRKKASVLLFKLWVACLIILSIGTSFYLSYQQVIAGEDPTIIGSGYHLFLIGLVLLFFVPLLCVIHRLSKTSASEKLHKVVTVMLVWLIVTAALLVFSFLFARFMPETFAAITSSI